MSQIVGLLEAAPRDPDPMASLREVRDRLRLFEAALNDTLQQANVILVSFSP